MSKAKRKLANIYLDDWALPFCLFLTVSVLMFFVGGLCADPVLQGDTVLAARAIEQLDIQAIALV
ncbi:MAG: hypothetical protein ACFB16_18705 [Phormidesmis sp.]